MALRQIWKDTAAAGREASAWGTAPTSTLPWFLGGSYFALPISADVGLRSMVEKSLPDTRSGYRQQHTYAPVPGNKRAEGGIQGDLLPASAGVLLYAAMGAVSTTPTADAGNPLGSDADISDSAGAITVTNPTSSAFLRFVITSAAGSSMSITVSGTTPNGDAVTETLPVTLATGDATVQTRYSYTGAVTATAAGFSSGACTVNGYTQASHVFTLADTPASYTIANLGDPGRGSNAGFYSGSVLKTLRIDIDGSEAASRATYQSDWIGKYAAYATAPTIYAPVDKPFAGWNASVTVEGSAYYKMLRASLNFNPQNTVIWTLDGTQDPRYSIGGPAAMTGQMVLIAEDDTEWGYFESNDELNIELTLSNAYDKLTSSVNKSLLLEMTRTYFTNAQPVNHNGAQAIQVDFVTIRDSSDGNLKATLVNNVYGY
jgi:hypothetical protein